MVTKKKAKKVRHIEDKFTKNIIVSDIHFPFQDNEALDIMTQYAKQYKPNNIVINGDLVDFYILSTFDKSPERANNIQVEINQAKQFLGNLRKQFKDSKMYFLEGNHEQRLQRYLWRNPELAGLDALNLDNLFELKKYNIKSIRVDGDYWGKDTGHLKLGDAIIMHGDNRLNGASTSKYSGYSSSNTMRGVQQSIVMGHVHRMAYVTQTTPYGNMVGIEEGCLCKIPGNANWQQGFLTFETKRGKNFNYRLFQINNGELIADGKSYKARKNGKNKTI